MYGVLSDVKASALQCRFAFREKPGHTRSLEGRQECSSLPGKIKLRARNGPGRYPDAGANFVKPTGLIFGHELDHVGDGEREDYCLSFWYAFVIHNVEEYYNQHLAGMDGSDVSFEPIVLCFTCVLFPLFPS